MKLFVLPVLAILAFAGDAGADYIKDVEQYRTRRENTLRQDDGWLTVVGLFRLKEGDNPVGSSDKNTVVLPASAPAKAGVVKFEQGRAIYYPADGRPGTILQKDRDIITLGSVKFFLIQRGAESFIRVKDNNSDLRKNFTGLKWFPIDPSWKITAKYTPYDIPKSIEFDSQNGVKQPMRVPGYVSFTKDGKEYRLDPVVEGRQLMFVIRDATSNKTTYGAARFVYADPPKNGVVILDFNKAINPPCAFTAFATCPLPPPQNRLTMAVTAGEKKYSDAKE